MIYRTHLINIGHLNPANSMTVKKTNATTCKQKQAKAKAPKKPAAPKHIGLVKNDRWLEPYEDAIRGRHDHAVWMIDELTAR